MNQYTQRHHDMTPAQIWAAWKAQEIPAGILATWQDRHGYYFNETGGRILARRLFHRLERDSFSPGRYLVLNDGCFLAGFWASSDADAIAYFERGGVSVSYLEFFALFLGPFWLFCGVAAIGEHFFLKWLDKR